MKAFNKVWNQGLLLKLYKVLSRQNTELLQSHLQHRLFRTKQEDEYSQVTTIQAEVPHGSTGTISVPPTQTLIKFRYFKTRY